MDITGAWSAVGDGLADPLHLVCRKIDVKILGLSGAPGSGKSTLAQKLDALVISLDDFYLSKDERATRDIAWRGPPGTHDLDGLVRALRRIRARSVPLELPRFDPSVDDRRGSDVITELPDLTVLEGFYVGYADDGYEAMLTYLDLLVFLDVPLELARRRRFAREEQLRQDGGGFSEDEMRRFWDEVLEPGARTWTEAAKKHTDIVIALDGNGAVRSVQTVRAEVRAALPG